MRFPNKQTVERVRQMYPVGTRVILEYMSDVQTPPVGTIGTVIAVDDIATVHIVWPTGSTLGAAYGEDRIRRIEEEQP